MSIKSISVSDQWDFVLRHANKADWIKNWIKNTETLLVHQVKNVPTSWKFKERNITDQYSDKNLIKLDKVWVTNGVLDSLFLPIWKHLRMILFDGVWTIFQHCEVWFAAVQELGPADVRISQLYSRPTTSDWRNLGETLKVLCSSDFVSFHLKINPIMFIFYLEEKLIWDKS